MRKLILMASRGEAKIFTKNGGQDLCWVKTLVNKKGRRKEGEFYTDSPGKAFGKFKDAVGSYRLEGKRDHTSINLENFAVALAKVLREGYALKNYDQAVIFASPKLIGLLKKHTKDLAQQVLLEFIPKNIEKASNTAILAHI